MAYTIRAAEGHIVAIEEDYGNAEEYKMFLNEVAEMEGGGQYTLAATQPGDAEELAMQKALYSEEAEEA